MTINAKRFYVSGGRDSEVQGEAISSSDERRFLGMKTISFNVSSIDFVYCYVKY